jgi:UDP-GlcNAc3NAcA epimerase
VLATIYRAENTDDEVRLKAILEALSEVAADVPVMMPLHPRTQKLLPAHKFRALTP